MCIGPLGPLVGASGGQFQPTLRKMFFQVCPRWDLCRSELPVTSGVPKPLHLVGERIKVRGAVGLSSSNFFDLSKPPFPELYNGNINT